MQIFKTVKVRPQQIILLTFIMITSCMFTVILATHFYQKNSLPYVYQTKTASNQVELHTIRTTPEHIGLKAIASNITDLDVSGINGGFFWQGYLLSIAVEGDQPVKGKPGEYGSGWFNTDRKRGTLVWDEAAQAFSVQVVEKAEELQVKDRSRYWAQGGVSMGLQNEEHWAEQAVSEEMPVIDEKRMRSGIVYDKSNQVYLVVAPTPCTGDEFRNAIKEKVGNGQLVDGLFLDGDGSSQLKLADAALPGDHREVFQMITLLN
ncbi:hypothetical protein [Paenibacillus hexagrammi]|uniref:Phosphodiester glycosidase domain-containing protein n=1 Tax=Paenibacillus hexagrammi TaxID=2908839 RepID=A0ABY3SMB3_9BACL|nr:hypothetical protein [Paenibacillus sp. YPD9-1]UJF34618.1 hypothetical protein L0M14_05430 [Paenibacillus sp. YPD9-1]